ncbi:hypothetical protein HMN09_00142700 [Mycena chlorophos]|uniref:MYND-type domain-containing protein n=1 Tax=Mycena chlorophos TaxID=658473 RepID=A0A8H6WMW1_MYCCL|nr:hypothetical protein HMN09_00142700 [Mycena chlorophos]
MHPALRLSRLSALSQPYRAQALAAVQGRVLQYRLLNQEISRNCGTGNDVPESIVVGLAPLFYHGLDTAYIEPLRQLGDPSQIEGEVLEDEQTHSHAVARAIHSLNVMEHLFHCESLPGDAARDCWVRLYPWMRFLYELRDHLPIRWSGFAAESLESVFAPVLFHVLRRSQQDDARALLTEIERTPRFWVLIGAIWAGLIRLKDDRGLGLFAHVLLLDERHRVVTNSIPQWYHEFSEGAGGNKSVAELLTQQLRLACPKEPRPLTEDEVEMIEAATSRIFFHSARLDTELNKLLCEAGWVPALTRASIALARTHPLSQFRGFHSGEIPHRAFLCISHNWKTSPWAAEWIAEALKADFLVAFLMLVRTLRAVGLGDQHHELRQVFVPITVFIPRWLISYKVLKHLPKALEAARALDPVGCLGEGTEMLRRWRIFETQAKYMVERLEEYQLGTFPMNRACDNLDCGQILDRHQFKRCGGCQATFYCSRACQKNDWKLGHREGCAEGKEQRTHLSAFSLRDLEFIRYFLNMRRQLPGFRSSVAATQLSFVAVATDKHPSRLNARTSDATIHEALAEQYFLVDFTEFGQRGYRLQFASMLDDVEATQTRSVLGRYPDAIARVRQSRGKLVLGLVRLPCSCASASQPNPAVPMHVVNGQPQPQQPQHDCWNVFPLHCAKTELYDELYRVAELLPPLPRVSIGGELNYAIGEALEQYVDTVRALGNVVEETF